MPKLWRSSVLRISPDILYGVSKRSVTNRDYHTESSLEAPSLAPPTSRTSGLHPLLPWQAGPERVEVTSVQIYRNRRHELIVRGSTFGCCLTRTGCMGRTMMDGVEGCRGGSPGNTVMEIEVGCGSPMVSRTSDLATRRTSSPSLPPSRIHVPNIS